MLTCTFGENVLPFMLDELTMNRKLSMEECIFYFRSPDNVTIITVMWLIYLWIGFPNMLPSSWQPIHNLNKRFEQSGSLVADLPHSDRPKSATTEENLMYGGQSLTHSPTNQ